MTSVDLNRLPDMILDNNEPVFNEPWEAQAFAMVVNLHQNGVFTWAEWAEALSTQIQSSAPQEYYQHWLHALESLVDKKQLTTCDELLSRKTLWHEAASRTPHGEPIELQQD